MIIKISTFSSFKIGFAIFCLGFSILAKASDGIVEGASTSYSVRNLTRRFEVDANNFQQKMPVKVVKNKSTWIGKLTENFEQDAQHVVTYEELQTDLTFMHETNDFAGYQVCLPKASLTLSPPSLSALQNWLVRRNSAGERFTYENVEFAEAEGYHWGPAAKNNIVHKNIEPTLIIAQIQFTYGDPILSLTYKVEGKKDATGQTFKYTPLLYTPCGIPNMVAYEYEDTATGEMKRISCKGKIHETVDILDPKNFKVFFDDRHYVVKTDQYWLYH
ncbi:MAG: hypothetical protein H2057_05150 [Alphaproteobacteria bacterium]|nr:hypothetical protein [Alphaproteobacteria bacterium]